MLSFKAIFFSLLLKFATELLLQSANEHIFSLLLVGKIFSCFALAVFKKILLQSVQELVLVNIKNSVFTLRESGWLHICNCPIYCVCVFCVSSINYFAPMKSMSLFTAKMLFLKLTD